MGFGKGKGFGFGNGYGRGVGYGHGRGKGAFSSYSCVKFVFFAFNVLFWLLGCAVLGVGVWMQVTKGPYASIAPSSTFFNASILCISAGVLILVIGFFGCCGAIMENQILLLIYFILVVTIFMLEIVASVLAFVYQNDIEPVVKQELYDGIRTKYPAPSLSGVEEGLLKGWEMVQSSLHCCGVNNYTDWYEIEAWKDQEGKKRVPLECCRNTSDCAQEKNRPEHYFTDGCFEKIKMSLAENLLIVGAVCISVVILQILGMSAAMAMFCCLRAEKYHYDD